MDAMTLAARQGVDMVAGCNDDVGKRQQTMQFVWDGIGLLLQAGEDLWCLPEGFEDLLADPRAWGSRFEDVMNLASNVRDCLHDSEEGWLVIGNPDYGVGGGWYIADIGMARFNDVFDEARKG